MNGQHETSWAGEEFAEVNLGDKRLDARLIKLCDRFSDAPESPINQACVVGRDKSSISLLPER